MRRLLATTVSAAAMIAFAIPAVAHPTNSHDAQHQQIDQQHADVHDQLDQAHQDAHDQGLTPEEHDRLHQDLQYQHDQADRQIAREHQRQHQYNRGRRYDRDGRYHNNRYNRYHNGNNGY